MKTSNKKTAYKRLYPGLCPEDFYNVFPSQSDNEYLKDTLLRGRNSSKFIEEEDFYNV